jgi:hypothetical protein
MNIFETEIREEVARCELALENHRKLKSLLGVIDELRYQIRTQQIPPKQKSPVLMTYDIDDGAVHLGDEHSIIEMGHDECDTIRSYLENLGIEVSYVERK